MFKKLKDKIAEEVKSSPQRIQQLTQSVTDRLQSVATDESFFTLGDDDASASNNSLDAGFADVSLRTPPPTTIESRTRKFSNSSMASDVSFFPQYEPSANLYHMQSDLDVSASEIEDNVSTSSQLGHINKEQVYAAFQKAQLRYHKYRGRYADMLNHYKILEKENAKIKAVLVETQDKAIRRVSELKEQCSLEQKAKAHLENALRVELDERQIKIDTLETKIKLLRNGAANEVVLLPGNDAELNEVRSENEKLNARMQELRANAIIFNTKESEYKLRIKELEKVVQSKTTECARACDQEKDKLAQIKRDLHSELHDRDVEISKLKRQVDDLEVDRREAINGGTKLENLQSQNTKLIEKVEMLALKCQSYESQSIQSEKREIENASLRETILDLKRMNETDKREVDGEYEQKIAELERQLQVLRRDAYEMNENHTAALSENESLHSQLHILKLQNDVELKENEATKNELEDLKGQLLKAEESRIKDLEIRELRHEESLNRVREDARMGLLSLETKIRDKVTDEYKQREDELKHEFERKLEQLTNSSNDDDTATEIKLMESQQRSICLERELEASKVELENEQVKYSELEKNHLDLIRDSSETRQKLVKLEKEIKEKNATIVSVRNEAALLQRNISELQEDVSRQRNNASDVTKLNDELLKVSDECSMLRNEIRLMQEVSSRQQNENLTLQESVRRLTAQVEDLTVTNRGLVVERQEIATKLVHESTVLKTEIESLSLRCSTVDGQLDECREENDRLKICVEENSKKRLEENEKLRGETETLSRKVTEHQDTSKILQQQLEEQRHEVIAREATVVNLRGQVQIITEENRLLQEELSQLTVDNHQLQTVSSENEKQLNTRNLELERATEEKKEAEMMLTSLKVEHDEIIVKLADAELLTEKLKNENESEKERRVLIDETVESLRAYEVKYRNLLDENRHLEERTRQIDEMAIENDSMKKRLREQQSALASSQTDLESAEHDRKKLMEDVAMLRSQIDVSMQESQKLEEKLSKLQHVRMKYEDLLSDNESMKIKQSSAADEISELKKRNQQLSSDYEQILDENEKAVADYEALKIQYENIEQEATNFHSTGAQLTAENQRLSDEIRNFESALRAAESERVKLELSQNLALADAETQTALLRGSLGETEEVRSKYDALQDENETLKMETNNLTRVYGETCEDRTLLKSQLEEMERHYGEIVHERQLLKDEIQELKISPFNYGSYGSDDVEQKREKELESLNDKLEQYKSIDKANRASIEFYEEELEKLKVKNEKLTRALDETLVTLPTLRSESDGLGDAAAVLEYLRNVLFNYMTGKESLVLAKVIAAVCKFDGQQTELIIQREQQKQTLLGHLFGS